MIRLGSGKGILVNSRSASLCVISTEQGVSFVFASIALWASSSSSTVWESIEISDAGRDGVDVLGRVFSAERCKC
jgi:hypothetical protein